MRSRTIVPVVAAIIALVMASNVHGAPLSWTSLTIDSSTGSISANTVDLVGSGACTVSTAVTPTVGGYSNITTYTLAASYLSGYDGISIDASPTISGTQGIAFVVPGSIAINAAWNQTGGTVNSGTSTGGVPGGTAGAGGFDGGYSWGKNGLPGNGPGFGGDGDNNQGSAGSLGNSAAGGSLVSSGGAGTAGVNSGGQVGAVNVASGFSTHPGYAGGAAYDSANAAQDLLGGSGGGGAGDGQTNERYRGSGGGGGGAIGFFASGAIDVTSSGSISVNGGDSGSHALTGASGGGGSGGTIILAAGSAVTLDGLLSAIGGDSTTQTNRGGGGAGGEIAVYYTGSLAENVTPIASGGTGGNSGTAGSYYTEELPSVPEPATMSLLVLGGLGVLIRRKRK